MSYRYCQNCGKKIKANAKFCPHCGAKQDNITPTKTNQAEPNVMNSVKQHHSHKKTYGIIGTIVIILIIVCGGFAYHQYQEAVKNQLKNELVGHTVYLNRYYNTDDNQVKSYYHAKSNHFVLASHVHFYKNGIVHIGGLGMKEIPHYKFENNNKKLVIYFPNHKDKINWYKHNNAFADHSETDHIDGSYITIKMAIVPKDNNK